MYRKVGAEAVLSPGGASVKKSIIWRDNSNIAAEWDGTEVDIQRHFKGRTSLNFSSGEMTITGLTLEDSALYTPEIDDTMRTPTRLVVMFPVPTPTVLISCDEEMTSCVLTCDGNTTGADKVSYTWSINENLSKEQRISKEESVNISQISCGLKNMVSEEHSPPILNPFTADRFIPPPDNLKISAGLTVFISLLAAVLLLVLLHRWKAGRWFFEEDHLPWQPGFWKRNVGEEQPEQNGTASPQETEETREDTGMA